MGGLFSLDSSFVKTVTSYLNLTILAQYFCTIGGVHRLFNVFNFFCFVFGMPYIYIYSGYIILLYYVWTYVKKKVLIMYLVLSDINIYLFGSIGWHKRWCSGAPRDRQCCAAQRLHRRRPSKLRQAGLLDPGLHRQGHHRLNLPQDQVHTAGWRNVGKIGKFKIFFLIFSL